MKVLANVNVSRRVVDGLRREGFDVVRVPELVDPRATDEAVVELARSLGAVLMSHDQDISAILAVSGASSPSLINLRVSNVDVEALTALVARVLRETASDLGSGAIVTVDDMGIRVHQLPV